MNDIPIGEKEAVQEIVTHAVAAFELRYAGNPELADIEDNAATIKAERLGWEIVGGATLGYFVALLAIMGDSQGRSASDTWRTIALLLEQAR